MRLKTLRTKDTKEFASFDEDGMKTSETPFPLAQTATMELLKKYNEEYGDEDDMDFDNLELVEFECFEIRDSSTVGADIRNKLTPSYNLLSLLKLYFKEEKEELKGKLKRLIEKEIPKCEETIKYISNLLD